MKFLIGLTSVLLSTLAAAPAETPGAELKIGQCAALSGPAAGLGQGMSLGITAAFEEANAKGGVHGRQIHLVSSDDAYEPEKCVDCTAKMVEDPSIFALAGYVGTPTAKVAVPILQETKVPLIGLFTGAMLLREPAQRYVVNVRASYDDETEALVEYLTTKKGAKKIAVFYQNDSFGQAGLSGTEKALAKRRIPLAAKGSFERNTMAVKSGLAAVMSGEPDAVIIVAPYKPTAQFVRDAKQADLKAVMATISFVGTENLIDELKGQSDGLIISQVVPSPHDQSIPLVKDYRTALKKGEPSYTSFEGYIAGRVLLEGLQRAGKDVTREKLIDAIDAMKDVDLGGLKISFSPASHQGSSSVFLTVLKSGKPEPLP
jgi:ABC-type branched-subunit amino acid transport system substrate-binding protein